MNTKFFEQVAVICDVYSALYVHKGQAEGLANTYAQKRGSLIEAVCIDQYKMLDNFFEMQHNSGNNVENLLWQRIQVDFRKHFEAILEYCRDFNPKKGLIAAPVFIKGLNAILNGCETWGIARKEKEVLMFLAGEVLSSYPDKGYRAAKDEYFSDKVRALRLWMPTDSELSIAQMEVIALENHKL